MAKIQTASGQQVDFTAAEKADLRQTIDAASTGDVTAVSLTAQSAAQAAAQANSAILGKADLVGGKLPVAQIPDAILGGLSYQAVWNAASNSPAIPVAAAENKGWYYKVGTAGATAVDGESDWAVGDWVVSNGSKWEKADHSQAVTTPAETLDAIKRMDAAQRAEAQSLVSSGLNLRQFAFSEVWDTAGSKDLGSHTATANLAIVASDAGSVVGGSSFAAITPAGFDATFDGAAMPGWSREAINIVGLYRIGNAIVWAVNGVQSVRGLATPSAPVNSVPTVINANVGSALAWAGGSASGHPAPATVYSLHDTSGNLLAGNILSGAYTPTTAGARILRMTSTNVVGMDVDDISLTIGSAVNVPGSPTNLAAVGIADTSQNISWTAPASTGGAAVSGYRVGYRSPAGSGVYAYVDTGSAGTSYVVSGINSLTTYEYVVAAINRAGTGQYSTSVTATTAPSAAVRFSDGNSVTEGIVGPVYRYTGTDAFTVTLGGNPSHTLAASADGWIACKMSSTAIGLLGFDAGPNVSWAALDFGIYPDVAANRVAYIMNGINSELRSPAPVASGMYRLMRVSGTVRAGYSVNSSNGIDGVWEEAILATGHTAKLYPQVCPGVGMTIGPVIFGGLS